MSDEKESSKKIDLATSNDLLSEDSETDTIESTSSAESMEKEKECSKEEKKEKEESNEDENHLEEKNEENINDKKEDASLSDSKITEKKKKKKSESPKKKISQSEKPPKKKRAHAVASDKISRRNTAGTMDRPHRDKVKRSHSLGKDKNELEPQKPQMEVNIPVKSPQPKLRSSLANSGRKIGNRISTWAKKGSREFETRERSSTSVQLTRRPSPIVLSEKKRSISHEDLSPTNSRETLSKRELVIREIITTESQYLGDVDLVIAQFLIPLRAKEKDIPKEIIQKIFGNIEVIRDVNSDILKELESRQSEKGNYDILVGDIFLNLVGF